MKNSIHGVINLYKPKGPTSFQVISKLKKILNVKKVGHTGTLDPQAEGVLVVCVGEATKIAQIITGARKVYRADILFGLKTNTWDMEGEITDKRPCSNIKDKIKDALLFFQGEIEQIPPMYSAISYKGKRLYKLAREGKEIERKPRKVTIYNIEFLEYKENEYPHGTFLIECTSGTYIRSIAYDLGEKIGCPSVLFSLTRERVGAFSVEDALTLEEIDSLYKSGKIDKFLLSIKDALSFTFLVDFLDINEEEKNRIKNGQYISVSNIKVKDFSKPIVLALHKEVPIAIGFLQQKNDITIFRPRRIFNII